MEQPAKPQRLSSRLTVVYSILAPWGTVLAVWVIARPELVTTLWPLAVLLIASALVLTLPHLGNRTVYLSVDGSTLLVHGLRGRRELPLRNLRLITRRPGLLRDPAITLSFSDGILSVEQVRFIPRGAESGKAGPAVELVRELRARAERAGAQLVPDALMN